MKEALCAEWTKLRTHAGMVWLLVAAAALTVVVSATAAAAATCPASGCGQDAAKVSLTGVGFGQALIAAFAVMAIGDEYGTGLIRVTFTAMPRRTSVLAAKAAVLGGVAIVTGAVAVLASVLAGRLILPGKGFTVEHGYPALSILDGPMLRAATGSVLYLGLIALLGLGASTMLRDSATAVAVVFALLFLFPVAAHLVTNPSWHRHLQQIGPMTAGLAIQATTDLRSLPIGPWAGLGVVASWAAAALVGAGLQLRLRDV